MPLPPTICGAIALAFAADPTLSTLMVCGPSDSPWLCEVPENKPLPFVAYFHDGEDPEWTMQSPTTRTVIDGTPVAYMEATKIRFEMYAQTAQAVEAIQIAIKAAFPNDADIEVLNCDRVQCLRGRYTLLPAMVRSKTAEVVFQGNLEYTFTINRRA